MALMDSYLVKTSHVSDFFTSIQSAQAPERFTIKFLENLGFASSNDRLFIRVLKGLNLIDDSGAPTENYYEFLDQSVAPTLLAQLIREAYSDLFAVNTKAYEMPDAEIKNKLKTLTQGKKSEKVISNMTRTFRVLSDIAEWEQIAITPIQVNETIRPVELPPIVTPTEKAIKEEIATSNKPNRSQLHYNIQIHLPESRDPKVYDAIFESLNKHLM